MVRWSLSAELLCIIMLMLLMFSSYGQKQTPTRRQRVYQACLLLSLASILLNILCVFTIAGTIAVPLWLNVLLNSLYFFISVLMCSVMAAYLFSLILEHVYSGQALRHTLAFVAGLTLFFAVAVLWNLHSGILFFFDDQGAYHRGSLNGLGYDILAVELVALVICYLLHRHSVSRNMVHVMRTLPPLVVLMIVFQRLYPEILLNGAIITIADLILYISFQSRQPYLDGLTGVGNRNDFRNELSLRLASRQRFQVILLGLQQFSDINHRFGHQMGDAFLYEAVRQLERLFPQGRVFRFGNVEFALLLPYPDDDGAARLQAIRDRFREPLTLGTAQAVLTVRLADLLCAGEHWTVGRLLEALEYSLDLARKGDGKPVRFQGQAAQLLQRRKDLVSLMCQALRERQFRVWYQPVWDTAAGAFTSAEALLRLSTPGGEPISPAEFIPVAEEYGLINELSWLVLDEVCRLLSQGTAPNLESVSVNLSMQQFLDPDLVPRLRCCLETYALSPTHLKIEITERVAAQDIGRTAAVMDQLSDMGVHFYLDDFGTGWSNLSCALDLPFQCVKLDHSLLSAYPANPRSRQLVHGLVALFHELDVTVVAEGVETQAQADALDGCGVDWLQGYHLARPMPEERLIAFLAQTHLQKESPRNV